MIGRCALGRAPLLASRKSFAARDSFARGHRCPFRILTMSIFHLTGVAFVGSCIFTLSTFVGARQANLGKRWPSIPRSRSPPRPLTGFARGRFFSLKSRPQHRGTLDCGVLRLVARVAPTPRRDKPAPCPRRKLNPHGVVRQARVNLRCARCPC